MIAMELRQLEYFVAVAEERSFTNAARRLRVAQSGLSATIKALEAELGGLLLARTSRRVELTRAGEAFLADARRTLASASAAAENFAAIRGLHHGTLRVGITQTSAMIGLGKLLGQFHKRHPGINLRLTQTNSADSLASRVHEGVLDLSFTPARKGPPDLRFTPVFQSPMVLVCRDGDPAGAASTVALSQLHDRELIGLPSSFSARLIADEAMRAAGLDSHLQLEVNDLATLLDLVAEGFGLAIVPEAAARSRPDLKRVTPSGGDWTWTVSVVCTAPAPVNPAAKALWQMAQQAWPPVRDLSLGGQGRMPLSAGSRGRGVAGSGLLGVGLLGEAAEHPFVEGGEHVELGRGEQVDEVPPDAFHVLGRRALDSAPPGGQEADHGAAAVGGVGFAGDQPLLFQVPDLVGEPALLPLQQGAHLPRGHAARGVLRQHREEFVVGRRQPGILEQELVQAHAEPVVRVHERSPRAVFTGTEPLRSRQHAR
jgi:DNA-binding transcriptional LysR family regulator